jgi:hypothetical protein
MRSEEKIVSDYLLKEKIVTNYIMKTYERQPTPENLKSKPLQDELRNLEDRVTKLIELHETLSTRLTCILKPHREPEDSDCEAEESIDCSPTTQKIKTLTEHIKRLEANVAFLLKYLEV